MNAVIDRASDLVSTPILEEMFACPQLRAHILERDWKGLSNNDRSVLRLLRVSDQLRFVRLDDVSYNQVACLRNFYAGISIDGLVLLTYCHNSSYPIYTTDNTMVRVAEDMGVPRYLLSKSGEQWIAANGSKLSTPSILRRLINDNDAIPLSCPSAE